MSSGEKVIEKRGEDTKPSVTASGIVRLFKRFVMLNKKHGIEYLFETLEESLKLITSDLGGVFMGSYLIYDKRGVPVASRLVLCFKDQDGKMPERFFDVYHAISELFSIYGLRCFVDFYPEVKGIDFRPEALAEGFLTGDVVIENQGKSLEEKGVKKLVPLQGVINLAKQDEEELFEDLGADEIDLDGSEGFGLGNGERAKIVDGKIVRAGKHVGGGGEGEVEEKVEEEDATITDTTDVAEGVAEGGGGEGDDFPDEEERKEALTRASKRPDQLEDYDGGCYADAEESDSDTEDDPEEVRGASLAVIDSGSPIPTQGFYGAAEGGGGEGDEYKSLLRVSGEGEEGLTDFSKHLKDLMGFILGNHHGSPDGDLS
ncbi:MAG: hypothetical protein RLN62_05540 [Rickettsiales bacterium]